MSQEILNLVGRRLLMQISDPWEFTTEVGTHPIAIIVERVRTAQTASRVGVTRTEELVVRAEQPFAYAHRKCEFFSVSPRHEGGTFSTLSDGSPVSANFSRTCGVEEPGGPSIRLVGSVFEPR